jgi:hypothetical protein
MEPSTSRDGSPPSANAVCFQAERRSRPSLWLLRQIAPHPRGMGVVAEAFGLPTPPMMVQSAADRDMADLIRSKPLSEEPAVRDADLNNLLRPLVEAAVTACWKADDLLRQAAAAQALLPQAEKAGADVRWLAPLRAVADRLMTRAAGFLVVAHLRSEKAEGAARAIGFARRGEVWEPPSSNPEVTAFSAGAAILH